MTLLQKSLFIWIIAGIAGVAFLNGCGPQGEQVMIQNARGTAYSQGYGDGCSSARAKLGISGVIARKDAQKFLTNSKYKVGWETGYKECKFREERVRKLESRK